jgi:N6-L-threonylcarbamoyladenine synthase
MLGLELTPNGGAALEAAARQGNPDAYPFALPMKKYANCDFSYAGLKTSVRLCIERELGSAEGVGKRALSARGSSASGSSGEGCSDAPQQQQQQEQQPSSPDSWQQQDGRDVQQQQQQIKADIAASFQRVAVAHLVARLTRAIAWAREEEPGLQHLVVAGGVASNQYVRQQVQQVSQTAAVLLGCVAARCALDAALLSPLNCRPLNRGLL